MMIKNRGVKIVFAVVFAVLLIFDLVVLSGAFNSGVSASQQSAEAVALPAEDAVEISVQQAAELRSQGAFILDVRQPEEWQEVHIPDATLIPLGELPQRLDEVPADQTVVVVCRSGNRSMQGRGILADAGFEPVYSMKGGMTAWSSAGLETESGK